MPRTSWFGDPELLLTTFSTSYICNNLSKHDDTLVYAHLNDVVFVNTSQTPCVTHLLPSSEKSTIHHVQFCDLLGTAYIVVASDNGVQIFDSLGSQSLYELALKDTIEKPEEGIALFCKGICVVNSSHPSIVVGTSLGGLLIVCKDKDAKASTTHQFDLVETISEHKEAVCCVESTANGPLLASSDSSGIILVYNPEDNFDVVHRIAGDGYPVTSMRFSSENWLICGYLTGRMRVYKKETLQLHAEIAAHSRAITALDIHENYVVSVGEDTFMNVWDIVGIKTPNPRIQLVSSQSVPNDLLTGVVFAHSKKIITASFDTVHLKLWIPE